MEKISAAHAMEWSIELEKGLRSKTPGQSVEAIFRFGPRLEQWSKEPCHTMGVLSMFGLVPGQDRLFANTILLRLAEAFRCGDKLTRLSVVKVFLSELGYRRKRGKQYNGILARKRVPNHLELLRRVKIVFDTGDVEARELALCLFGCWADFAKESAEIRYVILSSLESCHISEVKASLFAAGIRAFAKMGCSSFLASKAYKAGQKLLAESSEEKYVVVMLVSLSHLASKSVILISKQKDFLLSIISQGFSFHVQAIALRCLCFLARGGIYRLTIDANLLQTLFHLVDKPDLNPTLQCEALWILRKLQIFQCTLPNFPCMSMPEFVELVSVVEKAVQSPVRSKWFSALSLLVDISCKFKGKMEMVSDVESSLLPSKIVILIIDQIILLIKKPYCSDSEMKQECQSLLHFVLRLVEEYPDLGTFVLDKIRFLIQSLISMHNEGWNAKEPDSVPNFVGFELARCSSLASKVGPCLYRFAVSCLEVLDEASVMSIEVLGNAKLLLELLRQNNLFTQAICSVYPLLLHYHVMWNSMTYNLDKDLRRSQNDHWVEHETLTLEFAKEMITRNDTWSAYRAGKYAACHGVWFASLVTFRTLANKAQSDSCLCWLKSLATLALAESKILLLLFPEESLQLVKQLEINGILAEEVVQLVSRDANFLEYGEKIAGAYSSVCSSEELLSSTIMPDQAFYFQRWFLCLRSKVLEIVADIIRLVGTNPYNQQSVGRNEQIQGSNESKSGFAGLSQHIHSLIYSLFQFSCRFNKLAKEFDLLAASFMGLDSRSFQTISLLALSCSLLAFCTGFVLYFPNLQYYKNSITYGLEMTKNFSHSMLIQDLIERVWHVDDESSTNLKLLLTVIGGPNSCFHFQPRSPLSSPGHRERSILMLCRYAVLGVLQMQEEAKVVNNDEDLCQFTSACLLLISDVLKKWIHVPFWTPRYFFQVRPCIGAELFAFNADTRGPGELSIMQGFHLSLNLCLQLKNAAGFLPDRIVKFYCILSCRASDCVTREGEENKGQTQLGFRGCETSEMVDLNEELLWHVKEGIKNGKKHGRFSNISGGSAHAFTCFELNGRGQGFSTCLLDVSAFPVGSYKIKWHSSCIDNKDSYWSLLPLNSGPIFSVKKPLVSG
ncbi:uncharacterized protein LOC122065096 isoform X3 [Macadamia integrifolia]|uniref:uncharacterized protein LOC122065096 isoform X3 n=1 Tax=Macadamia integrifolia TaxID=60698 RepID=UPI001C4E3910|nr:uncharacterized protein LOC122065096 isoform X3 [Macadamia integrifolia]